MKQYKNISKSRQKNQEKEILEVQLYKRISNMALWRANNKPPVEMMVADFELKLSKPYKEDRKKNDT